MELVEAEPITLFEKQMERAAKLARLRTRIVNRTAVMNELEPAMTKSEWSAQREKVVWEQQSSLGEPSIAAYSAIPAERDDFKNHCNALMLVDCCVPGLVKESNQLRAMFAKEKYDLPSPKNL